MSSHPRVALSELEARLEVLKPEDLQVCVLLVCECVVYAFVCMHAKCRREVEWGGLEQDKTKTMKFSEQK